MPTDIDLVLVSYPSIYCKFTISENFGFCKTFIIGVTGWISDQFPHEFNNELGFHETVRAEWQWDSIAVCIRLLISSTSNNRINYPYVSNQCYHSCMRYNCLIVWPYRPYACIISFYLSCFMTSSTPRIMYSSKFNRWLAAIKKSKSEIYRLRPFRAFLKWAEAEKSSSFELRKERFFWMKLNSERAPKLKIGGG